MKHGSSGWFAIKGLRVLYFTLAIIGVVILIILISMLIGRAVSKNEAIRFEYARYCVETPLVIDYNRKGIARLLERPITAPTACWQTTPLPHISHLEQVSFDVHEQPFSRVWFEVNYRVPQNWDSSEALMVYIPRTNGLAWQVNIDGQPVNNNLNNWLMTWNTPATGRLLPGQFRPGQRLTIQIAIAFLPEAGYSASRITVGPASVVGALLSIRQFFQISIPLACNTVLILMAGFFLAFWLARRNETAHLLLALAAIAWSISNLQYIIPRFDDTLIDSFYSALVNISVSWFMWLIYLFVLRFDFRRIPWIEWALPIYVLIMSLFDIVACGLIMEASILTNVINAVVASGVTVLIMVRALWGGSVELRVIATALVLALLTGIHDVALISQAINPESVYLLPYGGMLVFASFLFAIQRRYVQAIEDHEVLSASLTQQLAEQKSELDAYHLRLRQMERKETLAAERQRLMHDMHDGIGSALLTALAAAKKQDLPQSALPKILRACVDDLRLVIDSLDPMEHELVTLLANVRYRLGPQLKAAGLVLEWEVDDLPELSWLESSDALHILRIIQEALANVIKHANATHVHIATCSHDNDIEISIADNGCGFNPILKTNGRGLRSLRRRSEELRAELQLLSSEGNGTTLILKLPIVRH